MSHVGRVIGGFCPSPMNEFSVNKYLANVNVAQQAPISICIGYVSDHANGAPVNPERICPRSFVVTGFTPFCGVDADIPYTVADLSNLNFNGIPVNHAGY